MKSTRIIIATLTFVLAVSSCKKEDDLGSVDNIPGLGGDTWTPGPIDKWIYDTLTVPYNIAVKYKWDQSELSLNKTLVPPKEEKVTPLLSAISRGWIQPYVDEAGISFFKNISPKFFILVGSPSFNSDGSITLGTAEGGRKVVLYNVNNFRTKGMPGYILSDTDNVKEAFHTIHHEFGHILDQNIVVPVEFSQSSASSYTSDWTNVNPQDALNEGFISQYAISHKNEDWAEMVSLMLVNGRAWFDNLVNSINYAGTTPNGTTAAVAKARLRQKESVVVSYFKQAWNIEFYNLQLRSRYAINSLLY
ncbi:zinc-binding metallopeptidase [Terrimonas alba]|uniref:zinc-binding metallopeptidase n=1 Tax=Terrimonas alba TaxID=3349636 RepID=UPI0035F22635